MKSQQSVALCKINVETFEHKVYSQMLSEIVHASQFYMKNQNENNETGSNFADHAFVCHLRRLCFEFGFGFGCVRLFAHADLCFTFEMLIYLEKPMSIDLKVCNTSDAINTFIHSIICFV